MRIDIHNVEDWDITSKVFNKGESDEFETRYITIKSATEELVVGMFLKDKDDVSL